MKAELIAQTAENRIGWSRKQAGCEGTHAWCAHFVSEILKTCGIDMYDLSCSMMKKKMSASSEWDEPEDLPERGDIIFFDWDRINESLPLDHVAVVIDYNFDTRIVTYVNGNGSSGTQVTEQTISIDNCTVAYWMRYIGDKNSEPPNSIEQETPGKTFTIELRTLRKGMEGHDVAVLQWLLIGDNYSVGSAGDDGIFGSNTEKAVTEYQKDHSLEVDGIAGKQTFTELLKR